MKIYIASSWKNQHAVEMLTTILRDKGHEVASFVENNHFNGQFGEEFDEWIASENAARCFRFDTDSAMHSDLVIYISPSGQDAAAECGMAYARGVPVLGLFAKGESLGLMRRMMDYWYNDYRKLIKAIEVVKS